MAKRPPHIPSKQELLAFINEQKGKVGTREIALAFGLKNADRVTLKQMLRDLKDEGAVESRRKKITRSGTLPTTLIADVTHRDSDGELMARPLEWDTEANGEAPVIRLYLPRRTRPSETPGIGDRALLRIEPNRDAEDDAAYTGRVIKLLDRARARMLGVFRASPNGGGRLVPVDKKQLGRELMIPPGATMDAKDGDLVAVDLPQHARGGRPQARVNELLGSIASEKAISLIAIQTHSIPSVFPREVIAEAEAAKPATLSGGREDWRKLPLITIDPADAKDHDDAVHAEPDDNPDNRGGFIVTVAIADVAHYVTPGSALDREALVRGNSVYFPDRVVPMLPERISNDLCSLRPREDRAALAVRMVIGADGRKRSHRFHRILMRSEAKLAYTQAQAAIDGKPDDTTGPLLEPILKPLWAAYAAVKKARDVRGPLDLDLPERKIILKPDGSVDRVTTPDRLDAHKLIEEFMILANVAAAESLEQQRVPLVYRSHDEPSLEKVESLREFLASIGGKLPKGIVLKPALFNDILHRFKETEHAQLLNEVVLRSQSQAEYTADNIGHFGLSLRRYAHFTSPIRRYADLIVHRALIRAFRLGDGAQPDNTTHAMLAEIGQRISAAERRAMKAERETVDRLIAHFLADRVGLSFEGRISGTTRSGLFVKLDETGADGFVPAATLGRDYYRYEENLHALIGQATGETFRLGDRVRVKLVEAAPIAGALRFEMMSEGGRQPPRSLRMKGPRSKGGQKHPARAKKAGKKGSSGGKRKSKKRH
ncbi:ribonuclease R [Variibacter gotjawalensis]|uniref:Ribonuclease R n=1 Tax=Variibacter gotjawalensis TaxID=1333996 RepID=A0A0S3PXS9_9BRAD|nr:ribonuclease R [Variibacter gotjawalensis]NIK46592.1 ribonuclease R [Variibacter gotjawalensis]RZS48495.1 RNAse R [Variibacter gotjawalensis]BAT60757.1 ribonuclease R [Variibacter gotjawalensis]